MDLAVSFEVAGTWGLERAFDAWVMKQDFRKALPPVFQFKTPNVTWQFLSTDHVVVKILKMVWAQGEKG